MVCVFISQCDDIMQQHNVVVVVVVVIVGKCWPVEMSCGISIKGNRESFNHDFFKYIKMTTIKEEVRPPNGIN